MKKYWLVQINFLDHSSGPLCVNELIPIDLFGILVKETKEAYHIVTWVVGGDIDDQQNDSYCVLKHKKIRLKKIKRVSFGT